MTKMNQFDLSDIPGESGGRRMEKYFVLGDEWGLISFWPVENMEQGRTISKSQIEYHSSEPFSLFGYSQKPFVIENPELNIAERKIHHDHLSEEMAGLLAPFIRLTSCEDSTGAEYPLKNGFAFGTVSGNAAIYGTIDSSGHITQLHFEEKGGLNNNEISFLANAIHKIGSRFNLFLFAHGFHLIDLKTIRQPLIYFSGILSRINSEIEHAVINDPEWQEGIDFGRPRQGHPEGKVIFHIADVLENIDDLYSHFSETEFLQLRLTALIHDTFKHKVNYNLPRTGENHHARIARKYAEKLITDETVLKLIEFHDHAYHAWGKGAWYGDWNAAEERLNHLVEILGNDLQLYYYFYWCDNNIPGKDQSPLRWFEERVGGKLKRLVVGSK